jgi:ABC-type amino acid transport substrate-binding protein
MLRFRSLLLVILLSLGGLAHGGLALSEQEQAFIAEHRLLRVAIDPAYPPFEMRLEGRASGFSPDYLRALAALIGVELEFVFADWSGMLELAKQRDVDIVSGVFRGGAQDAFLIYTEPYLRLIDGIFVRQGSPPLADWRDLAGKRVAIVRDYSYEKVIAEHHPEMRMVLVENALDGLKALSLGEVDAYLDNAAVVHYLTTTHFISNIELVGRPQFPESLDGGDLFFLGVRSDYPVLRDLLDKAMRAYPAAEKRRLHREWLQHAVEVGQGPRARLSQQERAYLDQVGAIDLCIVSPSGESASESPDASAELAREIGIAITTALGVAARHNQLPSWGEALRRLGAGDCDLLPLAVLAPGSTTKSPFPSPSPRSHWWSRRAAATRSFGAAARWPVIGWASWPARCTRPLLPRAILSFASSRSRPSPRDCDWSAMASCSD